MIKNAQWDIKTKIKTMLILFFAVYAGIFYFAVENEWKSVQFIVSHIATALAFSAFFVVTLTGKGNSLFSVQGATATAAALIILGLLFTRVYLSNDVMTMMFFLSLMLICSQNIVVLPVTAILSVIVAVKYSGSAVMCLPATAGASLIYLSEEIKNSVKWKKVLFAVSEAVIIGATVYTFWYRRYFLTLHSLVTEISDSVISVIAIAILVVLAVESIKRKRPVTETAGYIISAAFSVIPLFMYKSYVVPAGAAMIAMFTVITKDGMLADEIVKNVFKSISSKIKK